MRPREAPQRLSPTGNAVWTPRLVGPAGGDGAAQALGHGGRRRRQPASRRQGFQRGRFARAPRARRGRCRGRCHGRGQRHERARRVGGGQRARQLRVQRRRLAEVARVQEVVPVTAGPWLGLGFDNLASLQPERRVVGSRDAYAGLQTTQVGGQTVCAERVIAVGTAQWQPCARRVRADGQRARSRAAPPDRHAPAERLGAAGALKGAQRVQRAQRVAARRAQPRMRRGRGRPPPPSDLVALRLRVGHTSLIRLEPGSLAYPAGSHH